MAVSYLTGVLPQGKLGVGYAILRALKAAPQAQPTLTLQEVDRAFCRIKQVGGAGANTRRAQLLGALLQSATSLEQEFLMRLIVGELRQGALEGLVLEGIATAFEAPVENVRRAMMLAGSLAPVAQALAAQGVSGLSQFSLRLFQPVLPMLADTAQDVDEAMGRVGEAALDYKLDGARVQVHKQGDLVEVYSRALHRVTNAVPEVVEFVRALPARELVLDGEAIALDENQRPLPFQVTMRRFGRKLDVHKLRQQLPLTVTFFDALKIEGDDLLERNLQDRWQALTSVTQGQALVPRLITAEVEAADAFYARALAQGHEGVVVKALHSAYRAGRRGQEWLKLKSVHTLDLVVLAAEWGSGRRQGWLSNLHLGARNPESGGFVMLGKTFKGMTDDVLRWQTEALLARELGRDAYTVYVKPELVAEVAFNDVQTSPYPGGVALRFARLKRYRIDKSAAYADTLEAVRKLLPGGKSVS